MTYSELLLNEEWQNKRIEILKRDKLICNRCENKILENFNSSFAELLKRGFKKDLVYKLKDNSEIIVKYNSLKILGNIFEKMIIYFDNNDLKYKNAIAARRCKTSDNVPHFKGNITNNENIWVFFRNLHIHHTYYQKEKLPWEYPNSALTTLCWECHETLHKNEKVPFLNEKGVELGMLSPCDRCFGAGCFPEFNHVQNGICFKCNGAKYEEFINL